MKTTQTMNRDPESNPPLRKPGIRHPTVVWTLQKEDDSPRSPATWGTDGVVRRERDAVLLAREYRELHGVKAMALPLGKEPKDLHVSERPIITVGP